MKVYKGAVFGLHYLWNGRCWLVWTGAWRASGYGGDYEWGLRGMCQLVGNNYRLK